MPYRTLLPLALACLAGAAAVPAAADDAKHNFTVWGAGRQTCREFAGNMGRDTEAAWVGGYLTAYNRLTPNTNNIVPHDDNVSSVTLWLGNYCKQHPDDMLEWALAAYTKEMTPRRQTQAGAGQ